MTMGTLYLLPTVIAETPFTDTLPTGVLERARQIQRFYVEAAKTARHYLKAIGHPTPIAQLTIEEIGHDPDPALLDAWLAPLLKGEDAAIVSESGCPGIADPGAQLVQRAHELGIRVVPWVGPSSILLTLMASGLDGQRFRFVGYLPIQDDERLEALSHLESQSAQSETQVFIETPYRNQPLFGFMLEHLSPDTRLCVAADITGPNESIRTMRIDRWRSWVAANPDFALAKVPTVFALLAAPRGRAPRYAPRDALAKGEKRSGEKRPSNAPHTKRVPHRTKGPSTKGTRRS